ncbi:hypothetical protein BCR44DRAFT_1497473 [Catenaria anguillulae PL171]|uniref:DUF1754-domain-containing protein n=1 Tax=Catenaria anguillulae PL171 TaxID=765915 RepID=A0A1Y2HUV2_9FUNG|nr:hypothetical protein BCR44DRAFT_1497473 [Catenaria anguillulae PL171]
MSSAYDDVITKGGLKLKGGEKLAKVASGKEEEEEQVRQRTILHLIAVVFVGRQPDHLSDRPPSTEPVIVVTKTAAQLAFEEAQRKRQRDRIHKMASKSHKEKVDDFNKYLESLSEHHDIPKVGPG